MGKHRVTRTISIVILVLAAIYLVAGLAVALRLGSRGLGEGWGPGSTAWLTVPIIVSAVFSALSMLVLGLLLLFLGKISENLSVAQDHRIAARRRAAEEAAEAHKAALAAAAAAAAAAATAEVAEPVIEQEVEAPPASVLDIEPPAVTAPEVSADTVIVEPPAATLASTGLPVVDVEAVEAGVPHVDVPAVEADIEAPHVDMPEVEAHIEAPHVDMPEVELPGIDLAAVELPKVEAPHVDVPEVELPQVEAPDVDQPFFEMPAVDVPELEMPQVEADIEAPHVELPEVELPSVSAPDVQLPSVEFDTPALEAPPLPEESLADLPPLRAQVTSATVDTELPAVMPPALPDAAAVAGAEAEAEAARLRAQVAELEARLAALRQAETADADAPIELGSSSRLPGADETARIAAEMRAAGLLSHPDEGAIPPAPVTPESQADNLLLIQGIGPYYAQRLKEIGIVTFLQLAEASDETLARVTGTFSDRIKREDWRGQARRMAEGR